jgi:hypothetical protein
VRKAYLLYHAKAKGVEIMRLTLNKRQLTQIIKEETLKVLKEKNLKPLQAPGKMWQKHPILRTALKTVLKNKRDAGLDEFDGESSVVDFFNNDRRSASSLARILVGPYCDDITKCKKMFKDEGNPLKDGTWLESFAMSFQNYKAQMGGGGL